MQRNTKKGNHELYILISFSWDKKFRVFELILYLKKKCFAHVLCGPIPGLFIQIKLPFFPPVSNLWNSALMPAQPTLTRIIN